MNDNWYRVENADEIPSPALLVYPERIAENVRRMTDLAGGTPRLRPHVKTHKMPEVIRIQQEQGINKFKVATIAEAEMVASCGAEHIVLAYQLVGPNVERLVRLQAKYPQTPIAPMADDEGAIRALADAAAGAGLTFEVLLDLDNGMHRSGIAPGPRAAELYRLLNDLPGVRPGGLHIYDGHIRDRDVEERRAHAEADFEPVLALKAELEGAGLEVPRMVAGGTPTFRVHAAHDDRECSPGTCLLWDHSYGTKFPDYEFLHAAVLLTRVISKPTDDRLCLDLGYKAVSPDNPDPRVKLLEIDDAQMVVHNEEHLAIQTSAAGRYAVGDVIYGIPHHVCPTVALHQEVVVVQDGRAADRWKVLARDRKLTV